RPLQSWKAPPSRSLESCATGRTLSSARVLGAFQPPDGGTVRMRPAKGAFNLVVMRVNSVTFVAPNLAWGEARGGSIPRQWGCDRRATKPQAKFGATLRAAVLFGPGCVARSLQIRMDMLVARALPGPKTP